MRNYTTQMDAARKGIITPEISLVAEKEHMDVSKLMTLVAEGKVAICACKMRAYDKAYRKSGPCPEWWRTGESPSL